MFPVNTPGGTVIMQNQAESRPELSYVLTAATADEVHRAAAWLRAARFSPQVEIVLAAPATVLGRVAGRLIPGWVRLASAEGVADRKEIQVAGARRTSGAVVIVVSCSDDLDAKLRDPFAESPGQSEDPRNWAVDGEVGLPAGLLARRAPPHEVHQNELA